MRDELVALIHQRHRLDAEIARRTARWDTRGIWSSDGSKSPAARLSRTGRLSPPEAGRIVRRARHTRTMPATVAAWTTGDIGTDLVDLLATTGTAHRTDLFTRDETLLLNLCRNRTHRQAQRICRYWQHRADAELGHDDQRTGRTRTLPERLAAALVEMAERANAAPADGRRPAPLITVIVGEATLTHICELATGTVIEPGLVVPHLTDADVQAFLFDGPHRVLGTSTQRTFTGALRRAIQIRDRHCQHASGCDAPITECDVDHIVPDRDGGPTREDNGRLLCETHNRHPHLDDRTLAADHPRAGPHAARPIRPHVWAILERGRRRAAAQLWSEPWPDDGWTADAPLT